MRRLFSSAIAVFVGVVVFAAAPEGQERPAAGGRAPVSLPEGPGKEEVSTTCAACHGLNMITGATGYSQSGWRDLVATMVKLPTERETAVSQYLATHFPPKPGRAPELIAGDVSVTFREWQVPTLGQRSRDPLQRPDGTIWWNGQFISLIGRLNPDHRRDEGVHARPGVEAAQHRRRRRRQHLVSRQRQRHDRQVRPGTGEITVFPMPDPAARDPHTGIFDKDGTLFFTLQQSNMVGRLVPSTGEIKLITLADAALPALRPQAGLEGRRLGGLQRRRQDRPHEPRDHGSARVPAARPGVALAPAGRHQRRHGVVRQLALGRLGRLNPATGEVKEWRSPSGEKSHPYAIEVIDDVIWYNESGQRPDALVRFDPKTERFQSWAIPSGVGIIRHMRKTPDGNLAIHQTSTNRVGLAIIGKARGTSQR